MTYQQIANFVTGDIVSIKRVIDHAFIPFDPANTDYQTFKIQVADGTPLEDPEGNVMTQEQVDEFLRTIP
jgi:hypothetical protein